MAAAIALVVAIESTPGIDHDTTSMGLTAAMILMGASLPAGLILRERERRRRCRPFPRPLSEALVAATAAVSFAACSLFGALVLIVKSAWILVMPLAVGVAMLAAAFATALGLLLGVATPHRRALARSSLLVFVVLLAPIPMCCGDNLQEPVAAALSLLPTVAIARVIRVALVGGVAASRVAGDLTVVAAATLLLALAVRHRVARDRQRGFLL
jgi:hypothetical protein